jgi:hypothetical protein
VRERPYLSAVFLIENSASSLCNSKSSSAFSITVLVVELWGVQDGRIILVGCGVAHRLNQHSKQSVERAGPKTASVSTQSLHGVS